MKAFVAVAVVQTLLVLAKAGPAAEISQVGSLGQLVGELEKQKVASQPLKATSGDRSGRILAQYASNAAQKTAEAVTKLGEVKGAVDVVAEGIGNLTVSVNASDAQIIHQLEQVNTNLANGSDIVSVLNGIDATLQEIVLALTESNNSTILGQLTGLNGLLNEKLTSIEKTFGYDDYPPAPNSTSPA